MYVGRCFRIHLVHFLERMCTLKCSGEQLDHTPIRAKRRIRCGVRHGLIENATLPDNNARGDDAVHKIIRYHRRKVSCHNIYLGRQVNVLLR